MKGKNKGFTLMEMLIVVAIIAILVSISIPTFTNMLEKSREATDLANVRAAYADVSVRVVLDDDPNIFRTVYLKQKLADWQTASTVTIGGISHTNGGKDSKNWKGNPAPGGVCQVYYDENLGVILNWRGLDPVRPLTNFGLLDKPYSQGGLQDQRNYEIDSNAGHTKLTDAIWANVAGTLLDKEGCTWGYYGNTPANQHSLFWSSVDISNLKPGETVPVIIATADNKFYVAEVSVVQKPGGYKALTTNAKHKDYMTTENQFGSLHEAYTAYESMLSGGGKYEQYGDTL